MALRPREGRVAFDLWVGGGLGAKERFADRLGAHVQPEEAVEVCHHICAIFREHGSRREEANHDVCEAARLIGERGGFAPCEAAFLEITQPDIVAGFARLVERGARHVVVHPYFLSPGRHTRGDIPVEVRAAAERHPGVTYQITEPLAAWSTREVWAYILEHDVPYNPLHDLGYPSVGCAPCTTHVRFGEDPRAGRWRGTARTECGLHR